MPLRIDREPLNGDAFCRLRPPKIVTGVKCLRRRPEETALYRTVYQCRNELAWEWESRFQPEYGHLRDEVLRVLDAYLDRGLLAYSLPRRSPCEGTAARARCEKCSHPRLMAFSCRKRTNAESAMPRACPLPRFVQGSLG